MEDVIELVTQKMVSSVSRKSVPKWALTFPPVSPGPPLLDHPRCQTYGRVRQRVAERLRTRRLDRAVTAFGVVPPRPMLEIVCARPQTGRAVRPENRAHLRRGQQDADEMIRVAQSEMCGDGGAEVATDRTERA